MSKAVKRIAKATGIAKVFSGIKNVVKKVAKSKIGKILLTAAAVYFGGAALMGAMGGASAGTGIMGTLSGAVQGAGAGISSAWSGLTGAASAAMGGNFGTAASSLGQGFTGAGAAGSKAVQAANMAATGGGFTGGGFGSVGVQGQTAASVPGMTTSTTAGAVNGAGSVAATAPVTNPGIVSSAWNGLGEYGKMAAVQGGMQIAGGALQGKAAQDQLEDQRRYDEQQAAAARNRYNENVGTSLWGSAPNNSQYSGPSIYDQFGRPPQGSPSSVSGGPMYAQAPGLVGGNMQGYGYPSFPVYNPRYG